MTVAGVEEHPEHRQRKCPGGGRIALAQQPSHVVLQHRACYAGRLSDHICVALGEEAGKARIRASAPAEIVEKAQPVARRNRDQRLAGSQSQPWVTVSKRAAPRPRRNGTPRRPASQWSAAHSPSRPVPWAATTLRASACCVAGRSGRAQRLASTSCRETSSQ